MLIALLITLIFGGDSDSVIISQLEKYCKHEIDDAEKKESLKLLFDEYESLSKEYNKGKKERRKQFDRLQDSANVQSSDFVAFFDHALVNRSDWEKKNNDLRKQLIALLTKEQWNEALNDTEKAQDEYWKPFEKSKNKIIKKVQKAHTTVAKHVNDKDKRELCIIAIQKFESDLQVFLSNYKVNSMDLISYSLQYETSIEEISEKKEMINQLQMTLLNSFNETYFVLRETLTKKEWDQIKKSVNEII